MSVRQREFGEALAAAQRLRIERRTFAEVRAYCEGYQAAIEDRERAASRVGDAEIILRTTARFAVSRTARVGAKGANRRSYDDRTETRRASLRLMRREHVAADQLKRRLDGALSERETLDAFARFLFEDLGFDSIATKMRIDTLQNLVTLRDRRTSDLWLRAAIAVAAELRCETSASIDEGCGGVARDLRARGYRIDSKEVKGLRYRARRENSPQPELNAAFNALLSDARNLAPDLQLQFADRLLAKVAQANEAERP